VQAGQEEVAAEGHEDNDPQQSIEAREVQHGG
jgi:hypothetical protein